jgi:hypothetical protein
MHNPATDLEPSEKPAEDSPDFSDGYRVCLDCLPDGTYSVSHQSLTLEDGEDSDDLGGPPMSKGDSYSSFEEALKAVVAIVQENPMSADTEQAGFEAGYPPPPARATATPAGPMKTLARRTPSRRPMTA